MTDTVFSYCDTASIDVYRECAAKEKDQKLDNGVKVVRLQSKGGRRARMPKVVALTGRRHELS